MKKLFILGLIIIIVLVGLVLLNKNQASNSSNVGKIHVATSFYPLYYFASQIGGNKADVINITPSGAEPHDYDPSTQDIAKIERSNMLILNGGVEGWGDKIKSNLNGTKTIIIVAGQGLLTQNVMEEGKNQTDPHIWLDPIRAKQEVSRITQGYIQIDPKNTSYFTANQKMLDMQLNQLDIEYRAGLTQCSEKNIITSHAAFGYLATRYGLTQVPISGLSPDSEPSAKQLADVSDFAKKNNVKYIFFESLISPKLSQTIANEVGAKTLVLDPIEGVSDADAKAGKNYYTIMQDNLKNLQLALGCQTITPPTQ